MRGVACVASCFIQSEKTELAKELGDAQEETLQSARMFYESALHKVTLHYPHMSFNFDGLAFDDLVLPPSSEFYYDGLAVSDPARYLLPEGSSKTSPVLEETPLSHAEGQVEPTVPSHDGSPVVSPRQGDDAPEEVSEQVEQKSN